MALNTASVLLADTTIGRNDKIKLRVEIAWDEQTMAHRLRVTDERTDMDAARAIRPAEEGATSITMQQVIEMMPSMVEEIIVLNRLVG